MALKAKNGPMIVHLDFAPELDIFKSPWPLDVIYQQNRALGRYWALVSDTAIPTFETISKPTTALDNRHVAKVGLMEPHDGMRLLPVFSRSPQRNGVR